MHPLLDCLNLSAPCLPHIHYSTENSTSDKKPSPEQCENEADARALEHICQFIVHHRRNIGARRNVTQYDFDGITTYGAFTPLVLS